jgi:hypothetical protein
MGETAESKCIVCGVSMIFEDDDCCHECDETCIGCCMQPFSHQNTPYPSFYNYEELSAGAKSVLDYLDKMLVYVSLGDGQNEKEFIRHNVNYLLELMQEPIDLKIPTLEEQKRIVSELEELNSESNEVLSKLKQYFQDEVEET